MRVVLHGGFGEKGRTSLAVVRDGYRLLLDCGVKTSARGTDDYYPAIAAEDLARTDAIVVTHGHEDHVAALGWCIAHGFRGRILMTATTRRDLSTCLDDYAEPAHRRLVETAAIDALPVAGRPLALGPFRVTTGRSGHIGGGVWSAVDDGERRLLYCGDVVPASPVFAMDALPRCDAVVLDASYGDDATPAAARARQIADWVLAHPQGCALPTPLYGRSAELLACVPGPLFVAPGMGDALREQIDDDDWLASGVAARLAPRLDEARTWQPGSPLPRGALLCHDGMGLAGPSRDILALARATSHPVLFPGHVPAGSPGERLLAEGRGAWIRLPTHPTLPENRAMTIATGARSVLGHSCDATALASLARDLPALRVDAKTGDTVEV
jgi:glyoxylase-like metal-dependent hydrolase (beta-lactamase superfamily II)